MISIAQNVFENADSGSTPNATLIFNILSAIEECQNKHGGTIGHQIRYVQGGERIALIVHKVKALHSSDIATLRLLSTRILSMQFQFQTENGDPMGDGQMTIDILHSSVARIPAPLAHAVPKKLRYAASDIDWSRSCVPENDQPFVLRVISDVYNMRQLMPIGMVVTLEPLYDADFTKTVSSRATSKRKTGADAVLDETTETESNAAPLIGCCIHFVDPPCFGSEFLDFMAQKYGERWLGSSVLFPRMRGFKGGPIFVPAHLVASIAFEHTVHSDVKTRAVSGAKRLCGKIAGVIPAVENE